MFVVILILICLDTRQASKKPTKRQKKNNPPPRKYKMHRSPSSADISTYDGCGEASKKLQFIANFILLTASLVLIGTGNFNYHRTYLELLSGLI